MYTSLCKESTCLYEPSYIAQAYVRKILACTSHHTCTQAYVKKILTCTSHHTCTQAYVRKILACTSDYTCTQAYVRKILACTSHHTCTQAYVRKILALYNQSYASFCMECFGVFHNSACSTITNTTRNTQNHVKSVVTGLPDRSPITSENHYIALTVTRR